MIHFFPNFVIFKVHELAFLVLQPCKGYSICQSQILQHLLKVLWLPFQHANVLNGKSNQRQKPSPRELTPPHRATPSPENENFWPLPHRATPPLKMKMFWPPPNFSYSSDLQFLPVSMSICRSFHILEGTMPHMAA